MIKKILFTGGGSSGHVTPNLAIITLLKQQGYEVNYMGSETGIEKEVIKHANIPYFSIATGRMRRYLTWRNLFDPFNVLVGIFQAVFYIRKIKPDAIFSKGGFVSVPVVIAGWLNRIKIYVHESDYSPGLANKLSFPFATKILLTFPETEKYISQKSKLEKTGSPIRSEFFSADPQKGRALCGFDNNKKMILVIGGGLGSKLINETIRQILPDLSSHFYIAHICGIDKTDKHYDQFPGYKQFEYLHQEIFDVMSAADIIISRAGSNSLYEFLVLKKPHLLIPLSKKASRGDQIQNAKYYQDKGLSYVLEEENLTTESLLSGIKQLEQNLVLQKEKLENYNCQDGTKKILAVILNKSVV
jgi:UDP-N-acetylglucosamine--N-acetylmuramyl-(pentapeptide) pyrophosphoryl-undecaprenol N-acetylglucosamine transferase